MRRELNPYLKANDTDDQKTTVLDKAPTNRIRLGELEIFADELNWPSHGVITQGVELIFSIGWNDWVRLVSG